MAVSWKTYWRYKFKGKKHKIYTNKLAKGIYLIEVVNENGRYTTKVIVDK